MCVIQVFLLYCKALSVIDNNTDYQVHFFKGKKYFLDLNEMFI